MEQFCENPNKYTISSLEPDTLKTLYQVALYMIKNKSKRKSTWNVKLAEEIVAYYDNKKVICSNGECNYSVNASKDKKYGSKEFFSTHECEETCLNKVGKDVHVYIKYPENFPGISKYSGNEHVFYSPEYLTAQYNFYLELGKELSKHRTNVQYLKIIPRRKQITVSFSTFYSFTENKIRDLFASIGYGEYITHITTRLYNKARIQMASNYRHPVYSFDSFEKENIKHFIVVEANYKHMSRSEIFNEDVLCEEASKFFNSDDISCSAIEREDNGYTLTLEIPYMDATIEKIKNFTDTIVGKNGNSNVYEKFLTE